MEKPKWFEVHVCDQVGHVFSRDCWCEPVSIEWITGNDGTPIRVVTHEDKTLDYHQDVLLLRDNADDYVTRFFNSIDFRPPTKELP